MDSPNQKPKPPRGSFANIILPRTSPEMATHEHSLTAQTALSAVPVWGTLPQIVLLGACGVLTLAFANYAALQGIPYANLLYWLGLGLMFVPFAVRLFSVNTPRNERLALVLGLGLALYFVKILHSPLAFTFPDEFVHLRNLNEILATTELFQVNGNLPATPYYPGLEIVTSALVEMGGLSQFAAGLVIIGAARLIILAALFLMFELLSDSPRVAGIGALVYTANTNYLYWSAQFSYESLALPMAVVVLFLLLLRTKTTQRGLAAGLTVMTVLTLFAVILTHHLTSYVLCLALWAWVLAYQFRNLREQSGLARMAWIATLATTAWLLWIAKPTFGYLSPVFANAIDSMLQLAQGAQSARELFRSNSGAVAPLWERAVGLGSIALILAILPLGWIRLYRHYRDKPLALVLGATTLVFPLLLPLRLARGSWEISNRTSEFIFIGIAFIVAIGLVEFQGFQRSNWDERLAPVRKYLAPLRTPIGMAMLALLLFAGGVTAGWPPNARLSGVYRVQVGSDVIYPQGITAATWMRDSLDKNRRVAADYVNARLLGGIGNQYPLTGTARGIQSLLNSSTIDSGAVEIMRTNRLQYVLVDRRWVRNDSLTGMYFPIISDVTDTTPRYFDPITALKFERAKGVDRVYDSGNISVYQVEAQSGYSPPE